MGHSVGARSKEPSLELRRKQAGIHPNSECPESTEPARFQYPNLRDRVQPQHDLVMDKSRTPLVDHGRLDAGVSAFAFERRFSTGFRRSALQRVQPRAA